MPRNTRSSWGSNKPARRKGYRTLRYWADEHDGRGYMRHTKTIQGSKRDGDHELARIRLAHSQDRPSPTIAQAWEAWMVPEYEAMHQSYLENPRPSRKGSRESIKTSSYGQVKSTWSAHVGPRWGDVHPNEITHGDVQAWLDTMTEQVAKRALGQLQQILDTCLINECVDKNVARYKYRMPTKANKYDHGIWTLEELDRIILSMKGRPCEPAVIMSAIGGCRTGEALAPMLDEVRPVAVDGMTFAAVKVPRQVDQYGNVSATDDLKNQWSSRSVVIPPPWSARILEIKEEKESAGLAWLSDKGFGEPMGQNIMRRDFYEALDELGVPRRQLRALRRSWRSWIATKGISIEIMEKMMGHSDGTTTGRYYLQTSAEAIAEEMARACDWEALATRLRNVRDK